MSSPEQVLEDLAGAILDGAHVDWALIESGTERTDRSLLEQLKVLATLKAATAAAAAATAAPPATWGHLRVLEPIGRGSFGEVHRAWDTRLDREVALKLLPAESSDDAEDPVVIQEGRLLARVRHPNVVTIYGAERLGGRVGLWMEFIKGRTLEDALRGGRIFTPGEVIRLGIELCGALAAVHAAGLLHRDIKAQNVMLADDGRLVLMDFGAGREVSGASEGTVTGTPLYLAPEVLAGGAATLRSDVYSVGVLLYHLLTGTYPVQARDLEGLRAAHARRQRTALRTARPGTPSRLARVVERAIDPEPDRRYAGAEALGAALTSAERAAPLTRAVYAAAAAVVVLGVVWGGWQLRSDGAGGASPAAASATALVPSAIDTPIIAVLPFKNLSSEPDSDYFVDGLTDEVIRNLAVIDGLNVKSRTSSFFFKDKPRNIRDVGEQLQANLVVEGSVQRVGKRLRVNAQLVRVAGDVPLWSERFDRPLEDVFAIQDEISRAIVNRLRLTLGRGQRRYHTNVQAYDLYLRARALLGRRGSDSARQAAALFEEVTARDPAFAPAYAGLADAYAFAANDLQGPPFHQSRARIRAAAQKAIELDPLLAEAHAAMGMAHSRSHEWESARASFARAIELNPSLTQTYTNFSTTVLIPLGRAQEAEQLIVTALARDPLSLEVRRELGMVQLVDGRYEEAVRTLERVYAVDPSFTFVDLFLARALTLAGRLDEAWPIWNVGRGPGREFWAAHAYMKAGRRAEVERMAAAHDHPFRLAVIHTALGDMDRAFEALNRAADLVPHRVALLLAYPEMASLRPDPRLAEVRKKLKLP